MTQFWSRRRFLQAAGATLPPLLAAPALGATRSKKAAPALAASRPGKAAPLLGVYCGNTPADILQFETWLGRKVDGVLGYTGNASWADYDGSVGWAIGNWSGLDRRVFWSVPLIPKGATLEEAARGDYTDHYQAAAAQLAKWRPKERVLYLRTGWEFNGDWMPWSAIKNPKAFAGAFRQFVKVFRAASSRFRFEWNVNCGTTSMNPEDAYPGDDVVDLIGMDFYWQTEWDPKEPIPAWENAVNRQYGLKWHQTFAKAHGKPTAYSEWGVRGDNASPYVERAKAWFEQHHVVYQTYWNSNADYPGQLSQGQYPAAGETYRARFGKKGANL